MLSPARKSTCDMLKPSICLAKLYVFLSKFVIFVTYLTGFCHFRCLAKHIERISSFIPVICLALDPVFLAG